MVAREAATYQFLLRQAVLLSTMTGKQSTVTVLDLKAAEAAIQADNASMYQKTTLFDEDVTIYIKGQLQ